MNSDARSAKVDDIVLFKFIESNSEVAWKLGRLIKVSARKLTIAYTNKVSSKAIPTMRFVERSPRDVVILFTENELFVNSGEYFSNAL